MPHNNKEVLEYWNREDVESMYDKHLIGLEIELIRKRIRPNSKMLDAGCGEGEGALVYAAIPGTAVHAADFSETRLKKAARRLKASPNVSLKKVDFLASYSLDNDYDYIVSQRFLINLMEWELQKKVLKDFRSLLKPGGRLLMLEGVNGGVASLNRVRGALGLEPIPVKWHNLFFDDEALKSYMASIGFRIVEEDGLGEYFFLTRGIRPYFETELRWDSKFNKISANEETRDALRFGERFSRLKFWVFERI